VFHSLLQINLPHQFQKSPTPTVKTNTALSSGLQKGVNSKSLVIEPPLAQPEIKRTVVLNDTPAPLSSSSSAFSSLPINNQTSDTLTKIDDERDQSSMTQNNNVCEVLAITSDLKVNTQANPMIKTDATSSLPLDLLPESSSNILPPNSTVQCPEDPFRSNQSLRDKQFVTDEIPTSVTSMPSVELPTQSRPSISQHSITPPPSTSFRFADYESSNTSFTPLINPNSDFSEEHHEPLDHHHSSTSSISVPTITTTIATTTATDQTNFGKVKFEELVEKFEGLSSE